MKKLTLFAGLLLVLVLILVIINRTPWAASILTAWMIIFFLREYQPLAMRDIPLHELNEHYAIDIQVEAGSRYRSRYINLGEIQLSESDNNEAKQTEVYFPLVHYCDSESEKPVIVALHGIMDSSHAWRGWMREIGNHYRIVAPDLPGFGLTGPLLSGDYSIEAWVAFVDEFVRALGIDHFYLAGNSLGGLIAWRYAISKHSHKVDRLILVDPVGYPQTAPSILKHVSLPIVRLIVPFITPRLIFSIYLKDVYGNPDRIPPEDEDRFFELALRPNNRSAMIQIFRQILRYSSSEELPAGITDIDKPTLLLWGRKDRWIPPEHVKLWTRDVRNILMPEDVSAYQDAGHIPHEEIPRKTAHHVHQFISNTLEPSINTEPIVSGYSEMESLPMLEWKNCN